MGIFKGLTVLEPKIVTDLLSIVLIWEFPGSNWAERFSFCTRNLKLGLNYIKFIIFYVLAAQYFADGIALPSEKWEMYLTFGKLSRRFLINKTKEDITVNLTFDKYDKFIKFNKNLLMSAKVKCISYKITKKLLWRHKSEELGHSHQSDRSSNFLILSFFDIPTVDNFWILQPSKTNLCTGYITFLVWKLHTT